MSLHDSELLRVLYYFCNGYPEFFCNPLPPRPSSLSLILPLLFCCCYRRPEFNAIGSIRIQSRTAVVNSYVVDLQ